MNYPAVPHPFSPPNKELNSDRLLRWRWARHPAVKENSHEGRFFSVLICVPESPRPLQPFRACIDALLAHGVT